VLQFKGVCGERTSSCMGTCSSYLARLQELKGVLHQVWLMTCMALTCSCGDGVARRDGTLPRSNRGLLCAV